MTELSPGMQEALAIMAGRQQGSRRKWGPIQDVHKSSLYALERRGLAVRNGYQGVAKLTADGMRVAEALATEEES